MSSLRITHNFLWEIVDKPLGYGTFFGYIWDKTWKIFNSMMDFKSSINLTLTASMISSIFNIMQVLNKLRKNAFVPQAISSFA